MEVHTVRCGMETQDRSHHDEKIGIVKHLSLSKCDNPGSTSEAD